MKYIIALLLTLGVHTAQAEAIATMPNTGNGKIVLTNKTCSYKNKSYAPLKRAYTYTVSGYTVEGCFYLEDETVVIIWGVDDKPETRRYPISNFSIVNRGINDTPRTGRQTGKTNAI